MTPPSPPAATGHEGHVMPANADTAQRTPASKDTMHTMHHPEVAAAAQRTLMLQRALLRDPVIRRRIAADPALRRLMLESTDGLSDTDRDELRRLLTVPRR